MAINQKSNNDTTKQSLVQIANQSFDQEFQVTVVEPLGYDGGNLQRLLADNLAVKIVEDGSTTYVAFAAPASQLSDEVWQCRRITTSNGETTVDFANGSASFSNVATNIALLSYS